MPLLVSAATLAFFEFYDHRWLDDLAETPGAVTLFLAVLSMRFGAARGVVRQANALVTIGLTVPTVLAIGLLTRGPRIELTAAGRAVQDAYEQIYDNPAIHCDIGNID